MLTFFIELESTTLTVEHVAHHHTIHLAHSIVIAINAKRRFHMMGFFLSFVQVAPQASSSAGPKVVKTPIATTTPEEHPSNGQYHPTAEKLAVRNKNRHQGASHSSSAHHRRSGSHGSGNFNYLQQEGNSPRISPLRDRRVSVG